MQTTATATAAGQPRSRRDMAALERDVAALRPDLKDVFVPGKEGPGARNFVGVVTSTKMNKSITVSVPRWVRHKVVGKFQTKTTKIIAHDENEVAVEGDRVLVTQCRPLSKRKAHNLTQIVLPLDRQEPKECVPLKPFVVDHEKKARRIVKQAKRKEKRQERERHKLTIAAQDAERKARQAAKFKPTNVKVL